MTSDFTDEAAEAMSKRLVSALGSGWALTTSPLTGKFHFAGAVLAKIWHNGHEFAVGWTWPNLLQNYCRISSMPVLPWESVPRIAASSIEELELKLAVLD